MINVSQTLSMETDYTEPFEDRIDILYRELELAIKWERPSLLLVIFGSEYVHADADVSLENRLSDLGQRAYHIKIKNKEDSNVASLISELANVKNVIFFVEGLRWGDELSVNVYRNLNKHREFFVDNKVRVVFWLTENEAVDFAHYAPDCWAYRHRVIEFIDPPRSEHLSPRLLESAWQGIGERSETVEDLDAKIAFRTALLTDLPDGNESTAARANLLLTLGVLHWRRGDFEKAMQFIDSTTNLAAKLNDAGFEAMCHNAMALVRTDLGRYDEAVDSYQRAIALAPEKIYPWSNLGNLYIKLGQFKEALPAYQKAIEQDPADAVSWNGLGDVYQKMGRNDDAVYAYMKSLEIEPHSARTWSSLGKTYANDERLDEAFSAHQRALEIDRHVISSWISLGEISRRQGREDDAMRAYKAATEIEPENGQAWNELGDLLYNARADDKAFEAYQKALGLGFTCSQTYNNLASISVHKGNNAETLHFLQKGIELSNNTTERVLLWNRLGDTYRRLGDYDNAIASYRKADELNPTAAKQRTAVQASFSESPNPSTLEETALAESIAGETPVVEETVKPENQAAEKTAEPGEFVETEEQVAEVTGQPAAPQESDNAVTPDKTSVENQAASETESQVEPSTGDLAAIETQSRIDHLVDDPALPIENSGGQLPVQESTKDSPVDMPKGDLPEAVVAEPDCVTPDESAEVVAVDQEIVVELLPEADPEELTHAAEVQAEPTSASETVETNTPENIIPEQDTESKLVAEDVSEPEQVIMESDLAQEILPQDEETQKVAAVEAAAPEEQVSQEKPTGQNETQPVAVNESASEEMEAQQEALPLEEIETQPVAAVEPPELEEEIPSDVSEEPVPVDTKEERVEVDFAEWLNSLGDLTTDPAATAEEEQSSPETVDDLEEEKPAESLPGEQAVEELVEQPVDEAESACWVFKSQETDSPAEEEENPKSKPVVLGSSQLSDESEDGQAAPITLSEESLSEQENEDEIVPQKVELDASVQNQPDIDSKNAQIWNELGNIYFNAGKIDDAVHAFNKAMELDVNYPWTYYNLASLLVHRGQYTEAIPLYSKSIGLLDNPKEKSLIWNHLGDAHRRLGDHESAKTAYNKAQELEAEKTSLLTRARLSLLGNCRA